MTPRELLEQLNELDEHTRVEAKAASEIGKSVLEPIYYLPTEKLLAPWQAQFPGRTPQSGNQPVQPVESPEQAPQLAGKAVGLTSQSIQADAQSIQPSAQSIQLADLPDALAIQVQAVGRRATPDVIRRAIRALCAWRPLSADDLATLLDHTRIHLVNEHIRPMLQEGELQRTIPDQPNHPQQQYRAAGPPEESQ